MSEVAELRAAVRDVLDEHSTSARVRATAESEERYDDALWRRLTEVGVAGMEAVGATFEHTAAVLVELGRHLTMSPLAATLARGAGALLLAGEAPVARRWLDRIGTGAKATAAAGFDGHVAGRSVDGAWPFVLDADLADVVVLVAPALVAAVSPGALELEPTRVYDLTRRLCTVRARGVEIADDQVVATGAAADRLARALADRAALATACDSLGVAERALETTVDYLRRRVQFGRPVGSFQALKHECANMLIAVESSRVAVDEAVRALCADAGGASVAVSRAKAHVGDAAADVAAHAMTLHGGMGFTWEHDCHLMLKRAKLNQVLDGTSREHLRRLADLVLPA